MNEATPIPLDALLEKLHDMGGSDLHLKVGSPPTFRSAGELVVGDFPTLSADATRHYADELLTVTARSAFERAGESDFAFGRPRLGRFRANIYRQRGSVNIAIRSTQTASYSFESLGLPRALDEICKSRSGLVIVGGAGGSGKTTTLSAMIDHINATRRLNIITVEDPIEVVHADKMSLISQREVGFDTDSFETGLRSALRQDPDVVYVGELRERAVVDEAIRAARNGHLVLTSMLGSDVVDILDKIVDMYPIERHDIIRRTLGSTIKAVVCMRMMCRADGQGRVPAVEVLVNVDRTGDSIAGVKHSPALREVMTDGAYYGMQTFDQSLLRLQQLELVSFQDALSAATDPIDFKLAVQTVGLRSA